MAVDRALVVHGDGLDAIGVHGESTVAEVDGESVEEYTLEPADLGLQRHNLSSVAGGSPAENASDARGILDGSIRGGKRAIILANAGAAIHVSGAEDSLEAGVDAAREAIDSGAATRQLESLRDFEA
jgi:anthranilate phosphoribosyltransferase